MCMQQNNDQKVFIVTNTASKNIASQSKASISSRPGGNLKQPSGVNVVAGSGGGAEGGVPQVLVESTNSVLSKGSSHKEPQSSKVM